jgi:hypothetical protein
MRATLNLEDDIRRKALHLVREGDSFTKPRACYVLTPEAKMKFLEFLSNVKFPDGYASNISRCVNMEAKTLNGLKAHDGPILLHRILRASLQGLVRKEVYEAIVELGRLFKKTLLQRL